MTKRKIIKLGTATLVASLPSKWIKKLNLKQGDEIEVEEKGNELVFGTLKHPEHKRKEIDISELDTNLVKRAIVAAYVSGYDEILIKFNNELVEKVKGKTSVPLLEFIQSVINKQLIGLELVEQKKNSLMLKDLSVDSNEEFSVLLRRIFLLINSMGNELLDSLKTFDKKRAMNLFYSNDNIARFVNFCLRILNKKGHLNFNKVPIYYHTAIQLRTIAYTYKFISVEFQKREKPTNDAVIKAFEDICKAFNLYYELYYSYSNAKAAEFIKITRAYYNKVNILQYEKKTSQEDILLIGRLTLINVILLDLAESRYSLEN